jgi:hypothetical protein
MAYRNGSSVWTYNYCIMLGSNIARSINFCVVSGNNNKEMWQFAKHLEEQGYQPIEIVCQWGAEKPRLKVHGLDLNKLKEQLTKEVTEWNLKKEF